MQRDGGGRTDIVRACADHQHRTRHLVQDIAESSAAMTGSGNMTKSSAPTSLLATSPAWTACSWSLIVGGYPGMISALQLQPWAHARLVATGAGAPGPSVESCRCRSGSSLPGTPTQE